MAIDNATTIVRMMCVDITKQANTPQFRFIRHHFLKKKINREYMDFCKCSIFDRFGAIAGILIHMHKHIPEMLNGDTIDNDSIKITDASIIININSDISGYEASVEYIPANGAFNVNLNVKGTDDSYTFMVSRVNKPPASMSKYWDDIVDTFGYILFNLIYDIAYALAFSEYNPPTDEPSHVRPVEEFVND